MENREEIIQQVRRLYLTSYLKMAGVIITTTILVGWGFSRWDYFYLGVALLVVGALDVYVGRYIPLTNKHDTLLNKYGDVYADEAKKAIARYGIKKLTSTRWFEAYADEYCERRAGFA